MNGPSVAARGPQVAVAWFTEGRLRQPRVRLARSGDGGRTFDEPRRVDGTSPIGRPDVAFLDDGSVIVSWLARAGDAAELRVRRYLPDGEPQAPIVVARVDASRASGFPRLASCGDRALIAWTDTAGPAARVRTALLSGRR